MAKLRYLTHPQVRLDPAVPVPQWGLNEVGRARVEVFKQTRCLQATTRIIASGETKALETAAIIAHQRGIPLHVREDAHENDRSTTGFLPPQEFEKVADEFFAAPNTSVRGWERAIDAQARIMNLFEYCRALSGSGDVLMVGHGGVGTLLYCHLAQLPITRMQDQPPGGGNVFCYDLNRSIIDHGWRAMEELT